MRLACCTCTWYTSLCDSHTSTAGMLLRLAFFVPCHAPDRPHFLNWVDGNHCCFLYRLFLSSLPGRAFFVTRNFLLFPQSQSPFRNIILEVYLKQAPTVVIPGITSFVLPILSRDSVLPSQTMPPSSLPGACGTYTPCSALVMH